MIFPEPFSVRTAQRHNIACCHSSDTGRLILDSLQRVPSRSYAGGHGGSAERACGSPRQPVQDRGLFRQDARGGSIIAAGALITVEGVEGAGKSTLIARLEPWLESRGHVVLSLREPGATDAGEAIRGLVKDGNLPMLPLSELLLFEAARHELVERLIAPALERGELVLLDRFYDSTTAYQGYGRGLDLDMVERLHEIVCGPVRPHTTLLLDVDPALGLERVRGDRTRSPGSKSRDRFETGEISFLERVREGFLEIAARESSRFKRISCDSDMDNIYETAKIILTECGF